MVTDEDREKALDLVWAGREAATHAQEQTDAIAAALAEEREKARAPFLALAEEWEGRGRGVAGWYGDHYRSLADNIRRAAQEG